MVMEDFRIQYFVFVGVKNVFLENKQIFTEWAKSKKTIKS